jgi:hypothetical protein
MLRLRLLLTLLLFTDPALAPDGVIEINEASSTRR